MLFLAFAAVATLVVSFSIFSVIGDDKKQEQSKNHEHSHECSTAMESIPIHKEEREHSMSDDFFPTDRSRENKRNQSVGR